MTHIHNIIMSVISAARELSTAWPLAKNQTDSYELWLERLGSNEPVCHLDNGIISYDLESCTFIASQWDGVSEPFDTFEDAFNWVMAGCT